ncbi:MAG: O-antigen ligase family protein [Bacteroidales bacterium]|nr:O-antigen ligase family protein [Bacteroidales bacterium]
MSFWQTYFPEVTDINGNKSLRLRIHHAIYFLLLIVLAGSQSVSKFMMSGMEILLAVNWVLEWDMRRKFTWSYGQKGNERKEGRWLLTAFLTLMAVHLVWMIGSANSDYGWYDIFKKLPLIAIPLVVLTSNPLNRKQLTFIFFFMVVTTFTATVIGYVRRMTIDDLPYRQIIPFISHIRFALNICLDLVLIAWFMIERRKRRKGFDWLQVAMVALTVWFLLFLLIIRSYTGFIVVLVTTTIMTIVCWRKIEKSQHRIAAATILSAIYLTIIITSVVIVRSYYKPCELATQPLASVTANGNAYTHGDDGVIENGNYVSHYVCEEELRREWSKRSTLGLEDTSSNGYTIMPTLVRYLNGLGTTKDSTGMQLLTDTDVRAIERGEANPEYVYGNVVKKMYYVMLFEWESHRKTGAVKNFSVMERFELWGNAWQVFCAHPLLGVGTGDVVDECHANLEANGSMLSGTTKHAHNQYLTFLVTFGVIGFLIIAVAFIWAFRREQIRHMPAIMAQIIIVLVSFVAEDTLETLAGCVFAVLFICLATRMERDGEAGDKTYSSQQ